MVARILLVEDDEDHCFIMTTLLEHAGFGVVVAMDGETAVRQALQLRPACAW